jgi:hypothetical protein
MTDGQRPPGRPGPDWYTVQRLLDLIAADFAHVLVLESCTACFAAWKADVAVLRRISDLVDPGRVLDPATTENEARPRRFYLAPEEQAVREPLLLAAFAEAIAELKGAAEPGHAHDDFGRQAAHAARS